MCDVPRRTPCMAWSAAEPHATRLGGYGVFVRAALLESALGLLLSALPKPPASLRAPSRNADPARGGSEPRRIGSLLQRPYRTSVAITTTCQIISGTEGCRHTVYHCCEEERSFFSVLLKPVSPVSGWCFWFFLSQIH